MALESNVEVGSDVFQQILDCLVQVELLEFILAVYACAHVLVELSLVDVLEISLELHHIFYATSKSALNDLIETEEEVVCIWMLSNFIKVIKT